jgi:hypothetical protein
MPQAVRPAQYTWSNYAVPLLAMYCRCLYLAYAVKRRTHQVGNPWQHRISNVPKMAAVMYFTDANNQLAVLLGSTYVTCSNEDHTAAALNTQKRNMMNEWRGGYALAQGLAFYQPARLLNPPQEPFPPMLFETVVNGLYAMLQGNSLAAPQRQLQDPPNLARPGGLGAWEVIPDAAADAAFTNAVGVLRTAWNTANPPNGLYPIAALPRSQVWGHAGLKRRLQDALMDVVRVRWDPQYDPNVLGPGGRPLIEEAFCAAFDVYFAPHFFPAQADGSPDLNDPLGLGEVSNLIPGYAAEAAQVSALLYGANGPDILAMLSRFHYWVQHHDDNLGFGQPHLGRYGRCCETYPLGAITYVPPPCFCFCFSSSLLFPLLLPPPLRESVHAKFG